MGRKGFIESGVTTMRGGGGIYGGQSNGAHYIVFSASFCTNSRWSGITSQHCERPYPRFTLRESACHNAKLGSDLQLWGMAGTLLCMPLFLSRWVIGVLRDMTTGLRGCMNRSGTTREVLGGVRVGVRVADIDAPPVTRAE